ncbi:MULTISPECIES: hypothetical protein [Caldilinea]|jgi:hypothetical protein|uniref:Uncharacterized protein n=1 Tax=Caldilinea aerophila (strain DSM 14535 / JCM 11387 / NBRC 104270 / STL-6-O1) TaxID=926550 RepID=I0I6A2_CALAS|nr:MULTISPECIES: hypothetical protein [Caldilinea]MBO9393422.1 hypothetical protein [Caldilinea sp.]BAM00790.1 hypothetical protein CLDAP_27500 [Caldilinea aerophila DSM 14535 = NBRC 104270]GIV72131.1 MAG: hypothetical protein KatS3mg049_0687 [Caldilinea sp.]
MAKSGRYPSYTTCVARALSASTEPLSIDALLLTVSRERPLGKGARHEIYRAIRKLYQAVPVAPSQFGWLSHLLQHSTFRHQLSAEEARRGYLLLDELEHAVFFPQFFQDQRADVRRITVELMGGPVLAAELAVERKIWSLRLGVEFAEWIDELGGQSHDDILILVQNAVEGRYMMRLQPRESRDEAAIREQNIRLARAAEELVASSRRTDKVMPVWELAALLIGRNLYRSPIPPDDLHMVLHQYSALRLSEDGSGYVLDSRGATKKKKMVALRNPTSPNRRASDPSGDTLADFDTAFSTSELKDNDPAAWLEDGKRYFDMESEEDTCPDYESYLEAHRMSEGTEEALSHSDYHLLEAELEMLLGLEQEFGYLLPEQSQRVDDLAERLFIDLESFRSEIEDYEDDEDDGLDGSDDGAWFWKN